MPICETQFSSWLPNTQRDEDAWWIAYSATKAGVVSTSPIERLKEEKRGLGNMFFSKSTPAAGGRKILVLSPGESKTGPSQDSPPEPAFLEDTSPS